MNETMTNLKMLTSEIIDAPSKTYLRPTVQSALESLGHEQRDVIEALDTFFTERTLQ
jgi:hypothetical protein